MGLRLIYVKFILKNWKLGIKTEDNTAFKIKFQYSVN